MAYNLRATGKRFGDVWRGFHRDPKIEGTLLAGKAQTDSSFDARQLSCLLASLAVAKELSGWMSFLVLKRTAIRLCSAN
jgi:hypothetical protein